MTGVDPTASVDPGASRARDVEVGPYAVIDAGVTLESGCVVGPHAVIRGETHIGAGTRVFQFASVGEIPQDKKYRGEASRLEIGRDNTIREFVTINRGTEEGGGVTRIGDGNWIMAYVHIAHDCIVGNQAVFANGASLAGHVTIGDGATLGGFTLVHQFCRLGRGSFSSMGSCIRRDVPPWVMVAGDPARPHGINTEGLRRLGYESEAQMRLRNAYRTLYKKGLRLQEALRALESEAGEDAAILELVEFVTHSERGIVR